MMNYGTQTSFEGEYAKRQNGRIWEPYLEFQFWLKLLLIEHNKVNKMVKHSETALVDPKPKTVLLLVMLKNFP